MKRLLVFDFDRTLIDQDSDRAVLGLDETVLNDALDMSPKVQWTELMVHLIPNRQRICQLENCWI